MDLQKHASAGKDQNQNRQDGSEYPALIKLLPGGIQHFFRSLPALLTGNLPVTVIRSVGKHQNRILGYGLLLHQAQAIRAEGLPILHVNTAF